MANFLDTDFTLVSAADNTKHARFNLSGFLAGAENVFTLPAQTDELLGKTTGGIVTGGLIVSNGQLEVQDAGGTRRLLFGTGLSDASTVTLNTAATASRDIKLPNDSSTLSAVVAPASATVDKTGQTASIAATTIYTTVHAGRYRISAYAVFSAVTTPGNLTLSAIFTDPVQAQTIAFNRNNTLAYTVVGNEVDGELNFQATTGSLIRFSTTLTGVATYSVYFRLEALT